MAFLVNMFFLNKLKILNHAFHGLGVMDEMSVAGTLLKVLMGRLKPCYTQGNGTVQLHTYLANFLKPIVLFLVGVPLPPFQMWVCQGSGWKERERIPVKREEPSLKDKVKNLPCPNVASIAFSGIAQQLTPKSYLCYYARLNLALLN